MTFLDLLKQRYSCKHFDGRKISDQQLAALKEAIRLSPSSLNSQPWKVLIIEDQETKEGLFKHSNNQAQITTCSHLFVICAVHDLTKRFGEVIKTLDLDEEQAALLEKKRQMYVENKSPGEKLHYAQLQCYLAAMNVLNAATDLGLASCPMAGFSPEGYAQVLKLTDCTPTILVPVGYPADEPKEKIRLPEEKIFTSQ